MHGITKDDKMFYVATNGAPWHIRETGDRSVGLDEAPDARKAIEAAGLNWRVVFGPVFTEFNGRVVEVPGNRSIIREDTGEPLAVVKTRYSLIQNAEMFEFMDSLVAEGLRYETAGSLFGGRRVWMLARVPDEVSVGGDTSYPYLLCVSAHDGSSKLTVLPTLIRVVCNNTLDAAMFVARSEAEDLVFSVAHVGDVKNKIAKARAVLGLSLTAFKRAQTVCDMLVDVDGMPIVDSLLKSLFPARKDGKETVDVQRQRERFVDIFDAEARLVGANGYALLNAITGYADHVRAVERTRGGMLSTREDKVFMSTFYEGAHDFKAKGLELVLAMSGIYDKLNDAKIPVRLKYRGKA